MMDANKLQNMNTELEKNEGQQITEKTDNCLITLSSVPEREQDKEEDNKITSFTYFSN